MENQNLVKNTLDEIPEANPNAKQIIGLVKEAGGLPAISCLIALLFPNKMLSTWQSRGKSQESVLRTEVTQSI